MAVCSIIAQIRIGRRPIRVSMYMPKPKPTNDSDRMASEPMSDRGMSSVVSTVGRNVKMAKLGQEAPSQKNPANATRRSHMPVNSAATTAGSARPPQVKDVTWCRGPCSRLGLGVSALSTNHRGDSGLPSRRQNTTTAGIALGPAPSARHP